jgi:hypothetical protein
MVELSVMVGAWGFVSKLSSVICHNFLSAAANYLNSPPPAAARLQGL